MTIPSTAGSSAARRPSSPMPTPCWTTKTSSRSPIAARSKDRYAASSSRSRHAPGRPAASAEIILDRARPRALMSRRYRAGARVDARGPKKGLLRRVAQRLLAGQLLLDQGHPVGRAQRQDLIVEVVAGVV